MPFGVTLKPVANRNIAPASNLKPLNLVSASEFQANCPQFPQKAKAFFKIGDYHNISPQDTEKRKAMLLSIADLLEPHIADSVIALYYTQALKDLHTILRAGDMWGRARGLLVGAQKTMVPGPTLHLGTNSKNGGPTSEHNYWLEALDEKHRCLGLVGHQVFANWLLHGTGSFFDWVDVETRLGNMAPPSKVQYYDEKNRWKYMVFALKSRKLAQFCDPLPPQVAADVDHENMYLNLLSTKTGWGTVFSGLGFGIYVLSSTGLFYSSKHDAGVMHHSSFLHGKPCKAAGEWALYDGILVYLTHKTGHYRASPANLVTTLRELDKRTDISKTIACVSNYATKTHTLVMAKEFLTNGDVTKCKSLNALLSTKAGLTTTVYDDNWQKSIHAWINTQTIQMSKTSIL